MTNSPSDKFLRMYLTKVTCDNHTNMHTTVKRMKMV